MSAIVGPNGSGKSNCADALRWVLGEQRYAALRGKRTEDIIFAGSSKKAALGLAEVSVTFDNSDRTLPLDFAEVTITRRAYRNGENEYFINRSRVRLKDVLEATAPLAQSYSLITQGMVDAALSLRPEERRSLFEDAAEVTTYNNRKSEAEGRLNRTEENIERVADVLAELVPRMTTLEKQAQQAKDFYGVQEALLADLAVWYRHQWQRAQNDLNAALAAEERAKRHLDAGKAELARLAETIAVLRADAGERRARLAERHHESSGLHTRAQAVQQEIAVAHAHQGGVGKQGESLQVEIAELRVSIGAADRRVADIEAAITDLVNIYEAEKGAGAVHEADLARTQAQSRVARQAAQAQQEIVARLNTVIENARNRLQSIGERRVQLAAQTEQLARVRAAAQTRQADVGRETETAEQDARILERAVVEAHMRMQAARAAETEAETHARQIEQKMGDKRSQRDQIRARLDVLTRLQTSFAGYYGGVRAVMQAAQKDAKLGGIVDIVAALMEAPADLETALETALGGHLQDIVVETWRDAEAAIAFLKTSRAGRATFLPLDSLKPSTPALLPKPLEKIAGVRGIAADLIRYDVRLRPVYQQLLGRSLVVDDLPTARQALPMLQSGWMCVTLDGEIVRSGGAVTGGAAGNEGQGGSALLMREREARELPRQITKLEKEIATLTAERDAARTRAVECRTQAAEADTQERNHARQLQDATRKVASLQAETRRIADELRLREESGQQAQREQQELDGRETGLKNDIAANERARTEAETRVRQANADVGAMQRDEEEARERVGRQRTAIAVAEQRTAAQKATLAQEKSIRARLTGQLAEREQRYANLDVQRRAHDATLATLTVEQRDLTAQIERLSTIIKPLEAEVARLDDDLTASAAGRSDLSTDLLARETRHGQAAVEVQRARGSIETLESRATEDFLALAPDGNNPLVEGWRATLSDDESLTDANIRKLNERITGLRGKMRRLGAINPLAVKEYTEAAERHEFLTMQIADLQQAAKALRTLIKELDAVTRQQFAATFARVAEAFERYFTLLFNGGTAKLTLTDPDNIHTSGIDILAQPPGKRLQNLAALSGGERALVADALLFALLEVHPTPFCVMDEVDAALDEANVGRFCDILKRMSAKTQFIVITHNRGTIEAAGTIYGVTMGADSVSKVISLRVEQAVAYAHASDKPATPLTTFTPKPVLNEVA